MIDDFILMDFHRSTVHFHKPKFARRSLRLAIRQIRYWYPKARIHCLTNEVTNPIEDVYYHLRPDMPRNFLAKFLLYSLLDRPAMYMDTDIILLRPFEKEHLDTRYDFRLFRIVPQMSHEYPHYNAGIIWIKRPNPETPPRLLSIHQLRFSWRDQNDEYAVSYLISENRWRMEGAPYVNVLYRREIPVGQCQSVHYCCNDKYRYLLPHLRHYGRTRYKWY